MHDHPTPTSTPRATLLVAAILATLGLLASACGATSKAASSGDSQARAATGTQTNLPADEGQPTDGGKVVWGLEAETDSMSPSSGRWALSGHMMASAIFDPLVTLDADGRTVPYLAESFTPDATDTVWQIKLRSGITFHDGEPLDAAAVKLNLDAHKTSLITSKAMQWVSSIEVVDPLTVKITTSAPWATFPSLFTGQIGYIAAPAQVNDFHGGDRPIGTGPFVFKEWVKGDHFTATKNPGYWRKGLPHLDEIEFRPVADAQTRLDQLRDGTLDALTTVTPASITSVREDPSLYRLEYTRGEASFVVLNTEKPPFDNLKARQALAYATDTKAYIDQFGPGVYEPATGVYAKGHLGYLEDSGYPSYDVDKAKQLVQEYTAETGRPFELTYSGVSSLDNTVNQQALVAMWEQAGIKVDLRATEQADLIINVVLGQYQAGEFRLFNQPDPDNDWVWLSSSSVGKGSDISLNMPRYGTAAIDQGLVDGRSTTDEAARDAAYQAVNREVNAGVPYIWLARADWTIASTTRVHGYAAASNGSLQTLGPKTWIADLWLS